jgi:hypothetical protein
MKAVVVLSFGKQAAIRLGSIGSSVSNHASAVQHFYSAPRISAHKAAQEDRQHFNVKRLWSANSLILHTSVDFTHLG